MFIATKYRSTAPEIMDDFALDGEVLKNALDKIAKINQLLGGNKLTIQGIQYLINKTPDTNEIVIIDIGCGNGDMLREIANYGKSVTINFRLIGIDANNFTIEHAKKLSVDYPNISFECQDVFDEVFAKIKYDIALCTLTLHHFKDAEIVQLVTVFNDNSRIGIVINDLQRSALAYRLFQIVCFIFRLNSMSRNDGLVSILRGFKKSELQQYCQQINLKNYTIQWKWAFRYQWIIEKVGS
jgi:2-polyprenyl-3-methyl-5-hydroxy-6-metoxy-1,4-benzoquinol methylase